MHRLRTAFLLLGLALWPAATALAESAATPPPHPGLDAFLRARILESRGLYREAVMAYERAVASEPEVAEIRIRFASLLVDLGMADRAVEVLAPVEQLDWFGKRVLGLALAMSSARDSTRLPEAEATLRAALAEREDDPNLQLSLAQVVNRQGRTAEAEELVARLRRSRGGSPQLAAFHAGLLRQLGRPQEAVAVYAECAAAEYTGGVDCRDSLVELLVELGRPAEAGEAMLGWLTDRDLDQLLRAATLLYEGGRPGEALQTVQRVLRVAPDSPRARDLEAFLLAQLGRWDEATPRLRELQRKDRDNLDILLALAWATANTGDPAEARQWIERAWELVQEDAASGQAVRVALSAARVELVAGSSRQAREWLDRVMDPGESGSDLAFLLAESYRRDREWEEGVSALLRLQPRLDGQAQLDARAYEAEFRLRLGDERGLAMLRPLLDSDDRRSVLAGLAVLQRVERWDAVAVEAQRASEPAARGPRPGFHAGGRARAARPLRRGGAAVPGAAGAGSRGRGLGQLPGLRLGRPRHPPLRGPRPDHDGGHGRAGERRLPGLAGLGVLPARRPRPGRALAAPRRRARSDRRHRAVPPRRGPAAQGGDR